MSERRPHLKALEEIERTAPPGPVEGLRTGGIEGVGYAPRDATGWHRRNHHSCVWRSRATEEQERDDRKMWVRTEKVAAVPHEAPERCGSRRLRAPSGGGSGGLLRELPEPPLRAMSLPKLFSYPYRTSASEGSTDVGRWSLTGEQRRFFADLLAYLRDELEARRDPEAAEQRAQMFASLAGEAGRSQVLEDKRLAEEGFVYLFEKGKPRIERLDELSPPDAPAVLAEMERTAVVSGEYVESDGAVYVIEYGERKLVTSDPGDPSAPLRARWRELKGEWPRP